mmetsp:Transcript_31171/g.34047  ORF Transcript_31171/g.34047 Transcript_31171/m.34047 type:complete len:122 (-) Transcript_31171:280-645(-)|eukprot:gene10667-11617_t
MEEKDFSELSKIAGVDFNALRNKYKDIASTNPNNNPNNSTHNNTHTTPNNTEERMKKKEAPKDVNAILSKYNICQSCQGLGTIKIIYNFMTMERTCEDCDGESILMNEEVDRIIEAERMER